jgi:ligand-binding sensor domain-containing protein/two-component sensor histidine kinase
MRLAASLLSLFTMLVAWPARAPAKQLPTKVYTTADGLPRNRINCIVPDSRGFLWLCTGEGLSRFDGYEFTTYGTDQGLPRSSVLDFIETRSGDYWAATSGGLSRFHPGPQSGRMFRPYRLTGDPKTENAAAVLEDRTGVIWCGATHGLYRLEPPDSARLIDLGMPRGHPYQVVHALLEDREGAIWAGSGSGLYRLGRDGQTRRYTTQDGLPDDDVSALLEDRQGRIWIGCGTGLCRSVPNPGAGARLVDRVYTTKDGLSGNNIRTILETSEGKLWFGNFGGLSELTSLAEPDHPHFQNYRAAEGLSDRGAQTLAEDRQRNLWVGTEGEGAIKIVRSGFTTYGLPDGLHDPNITSIFEDLAGDLCVLSQGRQLWINRFDGQRFRATLPKFPPAIKFFGWGWKQTAFQDRAGEWWIPTAHGLLRFPKVGSIEHLAHTSPKALYNARNGLVAEDVFRLFEDSAGDIWLSTSADRGPRNGLSQWLRATGSFRDHSSVTSALALAFREDRLGALWIGFDIPTGLARYRNGRFEFFTVADGLPAGDIRDLYLDRSGRLWIASAEGGLGRIDDPGAPHPRIVTISAAQGLSGNAVHCITEDLSGKIYVGTGHGVDRLDPDGSGIRHYTTADGLSPGEVQAAFRDRHGTLWVATHLGLSQLIPEPDRPQSPPPIRITRVSIGGTPYTISGLGESQISGPVLPHGQNFIQFDFVGLGFGAGEKLRYQYRLEGAGGDWSAPAENRNVHYASLSPGRYRFLVRALNAPGLASAQPAAVSFTVLTPVWMRWWFVLPAGTALAMLLYAAHRYRLGRLLELERVRTRIATDLHDDIGASLSQISILSEVARRHAGDVDALEKPLAEIAGASRELLASMSDIVWSINPQRDRLRDLVERMRRFATEVFTTSDIEFQFHAPAAELEGKLDPDMRRQVFLIFKESVNNIVRHADCTQVEIQFSVGNAGLILSVRDDGKGFDAGRPSSGNGLASMRQRAASLKGSLEIKVDEDGGTRVILCVPARTYLHK